MEYAELKDNLDGFYDYDGGSTDSGIKNDTLKEKCRKHIMSFKPEARRALLAKLIIDMWLCEDALKAGYGPEDAKSFIDWLDEEMGVLV